MPTRIGGTTIPVVPGLPNRPGVPTTPTQPTVTTPVAPGPIGGGWRPGGPPTVWMKPSYDISIPDNLGRPPRTSDVTIKKGFDGRSPDEVVDLVRSNLKGGLDPSNKRFVESSIRENHRSFTIAVSNMFVAGSPPNRFVANLAVRNQLTVMMTMSSVQPVIISAKALVGGGTTFYGKGPNGDWVQIPQPKYPVVAQSMIRFKPEPGLTMEYPRWATPALAGKLGEITEL